MPRSIAISRSVRTRRLRRFLRLSHARTFSRMDLPSARRPFSPQIALGLKFPRVVLENTEHWKVEACCSNAAVEISHFMLRDERLGASPMVSSRTALQRRATTNSFASVAISTTEEDADFD